MPGELLLPLCGFALMLGLLVAAATDIRARIIPNPLNLAIAVTAPIAWWAQGLSLWPDVALQIGVAVAVFIPFLLLFNFGAMGGGDVKLIAALGLWITPSLIIPFLVWMSILGGGVAAVTLVQSRLKARIHAGIGSNEEMPAPEVPYGVAIAAAGCWVVYQQYINHFVGLTPS
jgi:prepilin peptidase CpaA